MSSTGKAPQVRGDNFLNSFVIKKISHLRFSKNSVSLRAMVEIKNISFEESLKELETIVRKLESGQTDLDSAIKDYERGNELHKNCEEKLAQAKLKVEKIISTENGQVKTELFDAQ